MEVHGSSAPAKTMVLSVLLCFVSLLGTSSSATIVGPEEIFVDRVWSVAQSPYHVRGDVIVRGAATLTIEPGVTLEFDPGVMLAVNGTLRAKGLPDRRIVMTKYSQGQQPTPPVWPADARLVDDRSVMYGRLQLLYRGRWRGACANAQNWTDVDTTVACRQLGFKQGNFSFLSYATNDSVYMLYHKPECRGSEQNILECPGARTIQIGSRVCVNQETVHLHCYGLSAESPARDNWWGLEFYNSSYTEFIDGITQTQESTSILENVDILHAGVDKLQEPVPAVRASPHAPALKDVNLLFNALDGTNFTDLKGSAIVESSTLSRNRGHGLVVETHMGRMSVKNSELKENMGDGIKTKFLDGKWVQYDRHYTFCEIANLRGMRYPQVIVAYPTTAPCSRTFTTVFGHHLSINILEMDKDERAYGMITIYDGEFAMQENLIGHYEIRNGTLPQGITTRYNKVLIQFTWTLPPVTPCPLLKECIKFTIMIDSGPETVPEFFMNNTKVTNNTGRGLFLENLRNYAIINASDVSSNKYSAGVRVIGGAGDLVINASTVNHNQDNGVNITYAGGYRLFNQSHFSHNYGNGVNITFNETRVDNKTRIPKHQRTEVHESTFEWNHGIGVRVGNYCSHGNAIVNDSYFWDNMKEAVEFESCFRLIPDGNRTNFTVAYNEFRRNRGHAVKIAPLINAVGSISNNTFEEHPRHVILIDNTDDFLLSRTYKLYSVDYLIQSNRFRHNRGFYVLHARLTQGSDKQRLRVIHNRFEENIIEGGFPLLNERTRAYAVVILSSSNVHFQRNAMVNKQSKYEVTTHLQDQSVTLDAKLQWWGNGTEGFYKQLIHKLFDQFSRYNLARIEYHPALRVDDLWGNYITDWYRPEEIKFDRGNVLGGRLATHFHTQSDKSYYIDRDITVLPEGYLYIYSGVTFFFDNSIGMLVRGELKSMAAENNPLTFILGNDTTYTNHSKVRLVAGRDEYEGRVEVRPDPNRDEWGTVCEKGWTILSASVVCKMLGLVVHPDDWNPEQRTAGPAGQPIWRSQVHCTELDLDITDCQADHHMDHSCNHTMDVHVRCKPPTWAGIQFVTTARPSVLQNMQVMKAGLADPTAIMYSPAIRIDYNTHTMHHLEVTNCMSTGIEIMKNDVYANAKLRHSDVSDNLGNGLLIRGSFFETEFTTFRNNFRGGIESNPTYTTYEAREIRRGIHDPVYIGGSPSQTINVPNQGYLFVVTNESSQVQNRQYDINVAVTNLHRIVMDFIDYNPETHIEQLTVYDNHKDNVQPYTRSWVIEDDVVDFPIESRTTNLYIKWVVTGAPSGRLAFVVRSKPINWQDPLPTLRVRNCTFTNNRDGIITRHYNQPSNEHHDLFFRHRLQELIMYGLTITGSEGHAIHAPSITKYHELYMPTFEELQKPWRLSEITYTVQSCTFENNKDVLLGEHNHVEFSNNAWVWLVNDNHFVNNKGGGFSIELPKLNVMVQVSLERFNHTADISDNHFYNNERFTFRVDGFYCNATMTNNRFIQNRCLLGCIDFTGTEKELFIRDNFIRGNTGQHMMKLHMTSHMYYTMWIDARVEFNDFKENKRLYAPDSPYNSSPSSYTIGMFGVQNITLFRNLFKNDLAHELVAGQASSFLETYVDVRSNYWGTQDQRVIQEKIFDFDDWNSFAIAEYYPYLLNDNFMSAESTGGRLENRPDLNQPLGGRIEGHFEIPARAEPYLVRADLTVMPDASLVIKAGVKLEFLPNTGILILGSLSARGEQYSRISLRPIRKQQSPPTNVRTRRQVAASSPSEDSILVRLNGGDSPDEGFIEMYNRTQRRWRIVCDNFFNDRTAEVACRTMNMETSNVVVRRSRYYDHFVLGYPKMHEQQVEWFWRQTLICDGSEATLDMCRYRMNYNIYRCMEKREYVYVRCGPRNLPPEYDYWGNIRFSTRDFEYSNIKPGFSYLEHTDIYGAGLLHSEKSAAIESVHRTPKSEWVKIEHSAWNGYDYVAPRGEFTILHNHLEKNNGYGIGGLVLNGESGRGIQSTFRPLVESSIPYNVFGLVRMCTVEKIVEVKDRILLYYKYRFDTIDCMKIIRSKERYKQVAIRFLQINLYNDTFYENAIEMFQGEYLEPQFLVGKVTANSTQYENSIRYETRYPYDVMSVRVTASAAHGVHGFIAEVVTLPLSPVVNPDVYTKQKIEQTTIVRHQLGGFSFQNVGSFNPSVEISSCRVMDSGLRMLNMTGPPTIFVNIQNSLVLTIANNYIARNKGGSYIISYKESGASSLYSFNITNNVIIDNTDGEALHVEGDAAQGVEVMKNYLAHNDVDFRNTVSMFGVKLNFTSNVMFNNTGRCNLNVSAHEQKTVMQRYIGNHLFDNVAKGRHFTTIYAGSAKHTFNLNFLVNRWNVFELTTYNRTKYPDHTYPILDATRNWWGAGYQAYVEGKVWHRRDDDNLIEVNYSPFLPTNQSEGILEGRCHPGWRNFNNKCYYYMGGVLTFAEATALCLRERSVLAWARNRELEHWLGELVASSQSDYNEFRTAWIKSEWKQEGRCTALRNYHLEHHNCTNFYPSICQRDPYMMSQVDWEPIFIALGVSGGALLLIIILVAFGVLKSKARTKQRLERRNSLRASLRSSKASLYTNRTKSVESLQSDVSKRRRPPLNKIDNGVLDLSGVTLDETSTESIDKIKMGHIPTMTPASSVLDYSTAKPDASSYYDSDLMDYKPRRYPPRVENEIANVMARPMYDQVIRNDVFDDRSIDRGHMPHMSPHRGQMPHVAPHRGQMPHMAPDQGHMHMSPDIAPPSREPVGYRNPSRPPLRQESRSSLTGQGSVSGSLYGSSDFSDFPAAVSYQPSAKPARPKPRETSM